MYKIERKQSGYLLTFGGTIPEDEMKEWVEESKKKLSAEQNPFCVVIDMRTLAPLTPESQSVMIEGQQLYKEKGMTRSAVIVNNGVIAMQFKRLAKASEIYQFERYIDGSLPDAQTLAIKWARDGIDPDKKK